MSEVPAQLVVVAFEDEKAADMILVELKRAKRARWIGIVYAAVFARR
jgi:uncharacterized membrane protein